ncbi:hypothetical protein BM527_10830 [Alteromonas sp. Mex14]|nr:hypothetical protein BM527_10830 [Alteromonas sp. Mex14]
MTSNLKCPLSLKHFELKLIEKNWVWEPELKTSDNGFDVFNQHDEFGDWVNFSGVGCGYSFQICIQQMKSCVVIIK